MPGINGLLGFGAKLLFLLVALVALPLGLLLLWLPGVEGARRKPGKWGLAPPAERGTADEEEAAEAAAAAAAIDIAIASCCCCCW